jgi:hypothetical protein
MELSKGLKFTVTAMMIFASMNLSACGKRVSTVQPVPSMAPSTPLETPLQEIPSYDDNKNNYNSVPTAVPNVQTGTFNVDQATLHDWQAKGIAVTGGTIYVSVADSKGLSKKGSVVKMSSSDGKSWKDIGSTWLGARHPMDATVQGLAVLGGTIIAVDSASKSYIVDATKGGVKVVANSGGVDVTAGAGSVFIANGMVNRSDMSVASATPINGLNSTGGVGSDNQGNVYAVSGTTIKKADASGQIQDVVTTDLIAPIDVAVDSRNGDLYVLESTMIKRFNSNGQLLSSFSSGAIKAASIAVDEAGAVYVADTGNTNKDSKVIKFAASVDSTNTMGNMNSAYGSNTYGSAGSYNSYGASSGSYGAYSNVSTSNTAPATTAAKRRS